MSSILKILAGVLITLLLGVGVYIFKPAQNLVAFRDWSSFTTIPIAPRNPVNVRITAPTDNISGVGIFTSLLNKDEAGTAIFTLWEESASGKEKRALYRRKLPVGSLSNNKGLTTFYFPPIKLKSDRIYEFSVAVGEGNGFYIHRAYNVYYFKPWPAQIKESIWSKYSYADLLVRPWLTVILFLFNLLVGGWLLAEIMFTPQKKAGT